jgi:hypothetical protein
MRHDARDVMGDGVEPDHLPSRDSVEHLRGADLPRDEIRFGSVRVPVRLPDEARNDGHPRQRAGDAPGQMRLEQHRVDEVGPSLGEESPDA